MTYQDIQKIFNRSVSSIFEKTKWLLTFFILSLCGILVVFFRSLSLHVSPWVFTSLSFLPIFLLTGVILSLGIFLIRVYHDEIKEKPISYSKLLLNSWDTLLGAATFTIPIILVYLLLWIFLGIFMLLREIPVVGEFFGVVLAFMPFLINFVTLVLSTLMVAMLFFVTPVIALRGLKSGELFSSLRKRFDADLFSHFCLFFIALLPFIFYLSILLGAAFLTGTVCTACNESLQTGLLWFFVMVPFAALLAPAVIFFFNFAAEAHVLMQKKI